MFPLIQTIDDVLPHIEGRESFFVKDLGYCKVVNYHSMVDAFGHLGEPGENFRRECRGIKFNPDGTLMARPLHKFFNVGERPETSVESLKWHEPHVFHDKWDGSMIHVGYQGDAVVAMTKMGRTETAKLCERTVPNWDEIANVSGNLLAGATLIFEFVAPWNRIVVKYDEPKLVLLAMRENYSGVYFDPRIATPDVVEEFLRLGVIIPEPKTVTPESIRGMQGVEGFVATWQCGTRVKMKSEWYTLLHHAKDNLQSSPKHAVKLILDGAVDDVIPLLEPAEQDNIRALQNNTFVALKRWSQSLLEVVTRGARLDQKSFALSDELALLTSKHAALKGLAFTARKQGGGGVMLTKPTCETMVADMMRDQCKTIETATRLISAIEREAESVQH